MSQVLDQGLALEVVHREEGRTWALHDASGEDGADWAETLLSGSIPEGLPAEWDWVYKLDLHDSDVAYDGDAAALLVAIIQRYLKETQR